MKFPARLAAFLIGLYQSAVSPLFPPSCRFHPTCSSYGRQAILRYGVFRGMWMLSKRLLRCHPFTRGGWDPVPESELQ